MKSWRAALFAALATGLVFTAGPANAEEPPPAPLPGANEGEVLGFVVTTENDQVVGQALPEVAHQHGREVSELHRADDLGATVVTLDEPLSPEQAQQFIAEAITRDAVSAVEPIALVRPSYTPPDPAYGERQWALWDSAAGLRMPAAWDVGFGSDVTVAVIDTGSQSHPELTWTGGYDFISNPFNARDGDGRDPDPTDEGWVDPVPEGCGLWHGTQVSGFIGAAHDGVGMAGIAPEATLVPIRVMSPCAGSLLDVADAIRWASGATVSDVPDNPNPARVINLSLGGVVYDSNYAPYCPSFLQSAIDTARDRGAVVVAATGNTGVSELDESPAICDGVIAVTASTSDGSAATWASKGSRTTLAAPGELVYTTSNSGTAGPGAPIYGRGSGTSYATPMVSAVAAIMLSSQPGLTSDQVTQRLVRSSRPMADCPAGYDGCGAGLLDAGLAVQRFTDVPTSHPFYSDIIWLADHGITTGYADGRYGVGDPVLREQMAAFLYRSAGSPPVDVVGCHAFADVPSGSIFESAICWMKQQGIATGYSETRYGYGDPVLREQMAAFLYRSQGSPPVDTASCPSFSDVPADSGFRTAICWMAINGITTGYADGRYGYGDPVLREQMAAFLHRMPGAEQ